MLSSGVSYVLFNKANNCFRTLKVVVYGWVVELFEFMIWPFENKTYRTNWKECFWVNESLSIRVISTFLDVVDIDG